MVASWQAFMSVAVRSVGAARIETLSGHAASVVVGVVVGVVASRLSLRIVRSCASSRNEVAASIYPDRGA